MGHPGPVVVRAGAEAVERSNGVPLGLRAGGAWSVTTTQLGDGDLLAYTDGLIEGRAAPGDRERFGLERLLRAVDRHVASGSHRPRLVEALVDDATKAHGGPLPDDVAVLHVLRGA